MGKIKVFSDSQPGVCSWHVLKILVNLSLNVLIEKVLTNEIVKMIFFNNDTAWDKAKF